METKLVFDATKPLPPYEFPKEAKAPEDTVKQIDLGEYLRGFDPAKDSWSVPPPRKIRAV